MRVKLSWANVEFSLKKINDSSSSQIFIILIASRLSFFSNDAWAWYMISQLLIIVNALVCPTDIRRSRCVFFSRHDFRVAHTNPRTQENSSFWTWTAERSRRCLTHVILFYFLNLESVRYVRRRNDAAVELWVVIPARGVALASLLDWTTKIVNSRKTRSNITALRRWASWGELTVCTAAATTEVSTVLINT